MPPASHGHGTAIGFRPLGRADFPLLSTWFAAPHVAPWWKEPSDLDGVEAR